MKRHTALNTPYASYRAMRRMPREPPHPKLRSNSRQRGRVGQRLIRRRSFYLSRAQARMLLLCPRTLQQPRRPRRAQRRWCHGQVAEHQALTARRRCLGPAAGIQRRPRRRPQLLLTLQRWRCRGGGGGGGGRGDIAQMAQQPLPVVLAVVVATAAAAKQVPPRRVPLPQPARGHHRRRLPLPYDAEGRRPQLALLVRGVGQGKVLGLGVQAHDGAGAADAGPRPCHHQFPNLARPDGSKGHGSLVIAPDRARAAVQPLGDCRAAREEADISRGGGGGDRGITVDAVATFRSRTAAELPP